MAKRKNKKEEEVIQKRAKCECGYAIRGPNHESGTHHKKGKKNGKGK